MLPFESLVLNKYRILRSPGRRDGLLGRGTFGSVYLAREELADRDVAIKELGLDSSELEGQQEEALRRFLTEGRLGLKIRHPNLLEIHAIEPYDDGYLLVMELAPRGDLKALLGKGRPELKQAIAIGAGIASGLHAAHQRGIIHRDLKPGNVFMMEDGTPKVADFGVAHIPQAVGGYLSMTRTGFQPGTVIYMSPEQASGRRIDHRADLYSLAVILFELLTGTFYVSIQKCRELAQSRAHNTPALEELRFFQVFTEVAFDGPVPRPSDHNPGIPRWLDDIVMRGLARNPEDRWHSGEDFAAALLAGPLPVGTAVPDHPLDGTVIDPLTPASLGRNRSPSPAASPLVVPPPPAGRTGAAAQPGERSAAAAAAFDDAETVYVKSPHVSRPAPAPTPAVAQATAAAPAPAVAPAARANAAAPQAAPEAEGTYVRPPARGDLSRPRVPLTPAAALVALPPARAPANVPAQAPPARPNELPTVRLESLPDAGATPTSQRTSPARAGTGTEHLVRLPAPAVPAAPAGAGHKRLPRWLLIGGPVAALLVIVGVGTAVLASGGKTRSATATPDVAASTVATAVASAVPTGAVAVVPSAVAATATAPATASPTASPTVVPPRQVADVPDSALLRPGATLVQRANIPGSAGSPGLAAVYSLGAATGGCQQPYLDLIRPEAGDKTSTVWDGTRAQVGDSVALPAVQQGDAGCFPAVKLFSVRPLQDGGAPSILLSVGSSDGSQRLLALNPAKPESPAVLLDLRTTPGADVNLGDAQPASLAIAENAYPPPGSGLSPEYGRPLGRLSFTEAWQQNTFQAAGGSLAISCTSGSVTRKGNGALEWSCPDGSPSPVGAASVGGGTTYDANVGFDDLVAGDDVAVTLADGFNAGTDPLNVLPAASGIRSSAAAARKAPKPTAAPTTAAPVRTATTVASSSSSTSSGTTSRPATSSSSQAAPVQSAPVATQAPVQAAPVATQAPASTSGGGLGTGSSSGSSSGGGLGSGSSSGGSSGGGLGGGSSGN